MREALIRFQRDVRIVGAATLELRRIRRCALECATLAFENAGNPQHGAWTELVVLVARLLASREKFPSGHDTRQRARLQLFVQENADVFEAFERSSA